jgi:hypothetical protein
VIAELEGAERVPAETQTSLRVASTYPFRTSPSRQNRSSTAKSLHVKKPSAGLEPATPPLPSAAPCQRHGDPNARPTAE